MKFSTCKEEPIKTDEWVTFEGALKVEGVYKHKYSIATTRLVVIGGQEHQAFWYDPLNKFMVTAFGTGGQFVRLPNAKVCLEIHDNT